LRRCFGLKLVASLELVVFRARASGRKKEGPESVGGGLRPQKKLTPLL